MPTVIDETVAPVAYDTSGNGGRKIANSSTGDKVFVVKNGTTEIRLYKKVGANAPVLLANFAVTTLTDVCIENVGNGYIGILYSHSGTTVSYRTVKVSDGTLGTIVSADSGQTAVGNVTMISNDSKTELNMSVSTKNTTYANSFNIRFNKGTIATDGSVAWGAVEQWTKDNTAGTDNKNPSISIRGNGKPIALYDKGSFVVALGEGLANVANSTYGVSFTVVYNGGGSYPQSSPSAIFVPQSINGLANGRIWVAWHGLDSLYPTFNNIRYSYSDDGGITWSAMSKVTVSSSEHNEYPTITFAKDGYGYALFQTSTGKIKKYKTLSPSSSSWSAYSDKKSSGASSPSALYDPTFMFTDPLFIYKDVAKVGFFGTWTVTTISVTQGSIGTKTDKSNLLTYAITTDGTMSTITEKVNGVTIGTKTATSGQSLIAGLTQAQWDAVRFGKYADATGGANTLTVTMGSEVFTYTFDKRLATDADILSAVKATQDVQTTYLPAVKSKLGTAIRAKGGVVNDTDALEVMASAVGGIPLGKKFASGTTSSTGTSYYDINVSGLSFTPSTVVVVRSLPSYYMYIVANPKITELQNAFLQMTSSGSMNVYTYTSTYKLFDGGFKLRFSTNSSSTDPIYWYAYE